MKKFSKAAKQDFISKVRKMKPAKGRAKPRMTRVPDASGPGGALK